MAEEVKIKRLPSCFEYSEDYDIILDYIETSTQIENLIEEKTKSNKNISNSPYMRQMHYDLADIENMQQDFFNGDLAKHSGYRGIKTFYEHLIKKYGVSITKSKGHEKAKEIGIPKRATIGSAGVDLQAAIDDKLIINAKKIGIVPTGLSFSLPHGMELQIRPRSGLAAKFGLTVLNTPGTLDSDYTGECQIILINHSDEDFIINRGDRVAQAVFNHIALPDLVETDELEKTERGTKGFGSSGIKSI